MPRPAVKAKSQMGFNAAWSMAVGGMVGGGIFSVLGVVVYIAGQWAWLSFVLGGLVALASAHSYAQLAVKFRESGGAFLFLRETDREGLAGSLSWILILGYVLTISVYGFTFGHYLSRSLGMGPWFPRACALAVIVVLTWVNLRGVTESSIVEIVTVWGKLIVLIGLAAFGIARWAPGQLTEGIEPKHLWNAFGGAAAVFMAYEGFQLLTYDYDEIRDAPKNVPRASLAAVAAVIVVYVVVTLGAVMLVGAKTVIEQKEVSLAAAGQAALGTPGLILVTIAAAFSTASAINATLFATARLMEDVSEEDELPALLSHTNRSNVPDYAVIAIGGFGALLAAIGSLQTLVAAASLTFLFTFCAVNVLGVVHGVPQRWVCALGALGAGIVSIASIWDLFHTSIYTAAGLAVAILIATVGRPYILRWTR